MLSSLLWPGKKHTLDSSSSACRKRRYFKIKWNAILPCFHPLWRCSGQRKENSLANMGCFWRRLKHFRQTRSKPFDIRWYWPSHLGKVCDNNVRQIECSVDSQRGKTWPFCSKTEILLINTTYSSLPDGTCKGELPTRPEWSGVRQWTPSLTSKSSGVELDQTRWHVASKLDRPSSNSNKLPGVNKVWV